MKNAIDTDKKLADELLEDIVRYSPKDIKLKSPELQQMLEEAKKRHDSKQNI